jgi:hypothetical protein
MFGVGAFSNLCAPAKLQLILFVIVLFLIIAFSSFGGVIGAAFGGDDPHAGGKGILLGGAIVAGVFLLVGLPFLLTTWGILLGTSALCRNGHEYLAWALVIIPAILSPIALPMIIRRIMIPRRDKYYSQPGWNSVAGATQNKALDNRALAQARYANPLQWNDQFYSQPGWNSSAGATQNRALDTRAQEQAMYGSASPLQWNDHYYSPPGWNPAAGAAQDRQLVARAHEQALYGGMQSDQFYSQPGWNPTPGTAQNQVLNLRAQAQAGYGSVLDHFTPWTPDTNMPYLADSEQNTPYENGDHQTSLLNKFNLTPPGTYSA